MNECRKIHTIFCICYNSKNDSLAGYFGPYLFCAEAVYLDEGRFTQHPCFWREGLWWCTCILVHACACLPQCLWGPLRCVLNVNMCCKICFPVSKASKVIEGLAKSLLTESAVARPYCDFHRIAIRARITRIVPLSVLSFSKDSKERVNRN